MKLFLSLALLFCIGATVGWLLELVFRKFFSSTNPEHRWINPGFCRGPYLPLYGSGLCLLYLICVTTERLQWIENPILSRLVLLVIMAACMTAIEYFAGWMSLRFWKVRLWDYTDEWANVQGIICPKYSLAWAILGALYYAVIHPRIRGVLQWFADHMATSFFLGVFFGIFIVDAVQSAGLVVKLKEYAVENEVIVRYEQVKAAIRKKMDEAKEKYRFFSPFRSNRSLSEILRELVESFEKKS